MKKLLLTLLVLLSFGFVASAQVQETLQGSNFTGMSYTKAVEHTGTNGAVYSAQANSNGGFQLRTSKKNTGITVKSAPVGFIVSTIEVTMSRVGGGVNIYAADGTINLASPGTAIDATGTSTTKTFEINKPYFAITATNDTYCIVSKVVVNWVPEGGDERSEVTLAWSETEMNLNLGNPFTAPVLSATIEGVESEEAKAAVVLTSSNEDLLSIVDNKMVLNEGVVGSATVTAEIPADNAEYKAAMKANFSLVVMDPNALDATFNFASYGWGNQKEVSTVTEGVVTLLFDKKENNNTPKYFEKDKDVRLYGGGSLTISVPEAYYLTKVESVYKNTTNDLTPSYGSFNNNFTLWTAEGMESSVEFTESGTSGNRSWTSIKVYFEQRPTEIVNFTHDGIVSKAHVASLKYTLHVANHKDDSMYAVTLTLKDKDGVEVSATNEEHSLVEAPVAMAPARAATATHYLSGSVGFDDLTPEMTYTPTVSYGLKGAEPTGSVELPAITMLTTGIEDVTVDGNEAAEYFNLQGVRVAQPEAGRIYIVRRGAKVVKELVK